MYPGVVTMFARDRIRWTAKLCRTENPVWIGKGIEKTKVLETPIGRIEAIPFGLFDTHAQITLRIRAKTCGGNQKRLKQIAFAISRLQQKRAVEKPWTSLVVQVALVLVVIAIDTETSIAKLQTRDDSEITRILA